MNDTSRILVYTPFKVGSVNLCYLLRNVGYKLLMHNDINKMNDWYNDNKQFVLKGHTIPMDNIFAQNKQYDIWFTLIRKPTDLYISAFFQDIATPNYPYSYKSKEDVMNADNDDLIKTFLSHEWENYQPTSFHFNFDKIRNYTNIDLWSLPFDKQKGYAIHKTNNDKCKYVVVLNVDIMNDDRIIKLFGELNIPYVPNKINKNVGNNKWYAKKYASFKNEIINHKEYYNKYENVDKLINDKFLS